jgi:hypothetical protein
MPTLLMAAVLVGVAFMALAYRGPWPALRPYTHWGLRLPAGLTLAAVMWHVSQQDWPRTLVYAFSTAVLYAAAQAVHRITKTEAQASRTEGAR